ncbi:MAG: hypothetical protein MZU97_11625 [Bacillus subtilis]|nr:hypothetical protein [Bacillus subtilis]
MNNAQRYIRKIRQLEIPSASLDPYYDALVWLSPLKTAIEACIDPKGPGLRQRLRRPRPGPHEDLRQSAEDRREDAEPSAQRGRQAHRLDHHDQKRPSRPAGPRRIQEQLQGHHPRPVRLDGNRLHRADGLRRVEQPDRRTLPSRKPKRLKRSCRNCPRWSAPTPKSSRRMPRS